MKKILIALMASIMFACGGEPAEDFDPEPRGDRCELDNAICEHVAIRNQSFYGQWFALRDCSWDYGVCIGQMGETKCEDWCAWEAWNPSECMYSCTAYGPPQTTTSTTGE